MTTYTGKSARFSSDGRYRYRLTREWRFPHDPKHWRWWSIKDGAGNKMGEPKSCLFVMLNPSTADGNKDDPTINRCVSFAKSMRYERLEVVNLFAFRTPSPKVLLSVPEADDPVGWQNQEIVELAAEDAGIIICAWGAHGAHMGQDDTMLGWLSGHEKKLHHLGQLTKHGMPRHPLYLGAWSRPSPFVK